MDLIITLTAFHLVVTYIVFMVQPMSLYYMYLINVQSLYLNSLSIVGDWMGGGHKTFC